MASSRAYVDSWHPCKHGATLGDCAGPTCFAGVCDGPCIVQLDLQLGQGARPGSISRAEELPLPLTAAIRVACKAPLGLLVQLLCAMCRTVSCLASIPQARPTAEAAHTSKQLPLSPTPAPDTSKQVLMLLGVAVFSTAMLLQICPLMSPQAVATPPTDSLQTVRKC